MSAVALRSSRTSRYSLTPEGAVPGTPAIHDAWPGGTPKRRFLDLVRQASRPRHSSRRSRDAYVHWSRRNSLFHGKRHLAETGGPDLTAFPAFVPGDDNVAPSAQNRALNALSSRTERCSPSTFGSSTPSSADRPLP